MEEINVDELERNGGENKNNFEIERIKNIVKKRMERKEFETETRQKPQKKGIVSFKNMKLPKMKPPPQKKISIQEKNEVYLGFQNVVYELMSQPMRNEEKRPTFKKKLKNSAFMDRFTKEQLYNNYIEKFNDKQKFAMVYGFYYFDTLLNNEIEKIEEKPKPKPRPKRTPLNIVISSESESENEE